MASTIGIEYELFTLEGFESFGIDGKHIYIVYTDSEARQYVLEGGLYDEHPTNITVRTGELYRGDYGTQPDGFIAKPDETAATYVDLGIAGSDAETTWNNMLQHAQSIEDANIEYVFSPGPNSNSVAASILNDSGFNAVELLELKLPSDINSTNAMSYIMSGQSDLFSVGFIGATNLLEGVVTEEHTTDKPLSAYSHLLSYGVTMEVAKDFILGNMEDLSFIHSTCKTFGVTNDMIAEILEPSFPGLNGTIVADFFASNGINSTDLGGSTPTVDIFIA